MIEEQVSQQNGRADLHSLNIKELLFKYLRYWPLFVLSIGLALLGSWAYLRWSTPVYQSSGILLVQSEKNSSSSSDKLEEVMMVDRMKDVQTEMEVLRSRPMLQRVVNALHLNTAVFVKGNIKERLAYKDLPFEVSIIKVNDSSSNFSFNLTFNDNKTFQVDQEKRLYTFNQAFTTPGGTFMLVPTARPGKVEECRVVWTSTLQMANALSSSLDIVPKQNTGILTIAMTSANPLLASEVINQLMVEYGRANIEDKNLTTYQQLEFINQRIRQSLHELDSINNGYVQYKEQNKIIDPTTQGSNYLATVDDNNQKLNEQRVQLQNAMQIEQYVSTSSDPVPSSLGIEDPMLNNLLEAYNTSQMQRKELLENAPPGNVLVQQKTQEVESLRKKILENVKNIRKGFGNVVGSLQKSSGSAISKMSTMPANERRLADIQRNLESKAFLYNDLLATKEKLSLALASTISNTKILQEALPNYFPVKPSRGAVRLLALIIGLLVPISIIILIDLLNDKVTSRSDIEKLTDANILGEIGHSEGNATLVVTQGNRKVIAEQFRILRSSLQYVLRNVEKPVILVTSSFSGEGKSFISTNTGAVLSVMNKKTIILEFDIRKPKVLSHLGLPKRHGLTNFLLGKVTVEELPLKVPGYEHLYVLPCGPLPPNPAEILLDSKLDAPFAYLKENFDAVVMDTAPVGMVSDAMTLSKYADCTLYIVRQGHTYKKQIGMIDEYYRQGKLPKISIVMNDVQVKSGYGYYGYGRYGYGNAYGYGSGYFEDDKPTTGLGKWFGWLGMKNGVDKKKKKATKV